MERLASSSGLTLDSAKVDDLAVARPYAQAAYRHAATAGATVAWERMLTSLAELVGMAPMVALITDPALAAAARAAAVEAVLERALPAAEFGPERAKFGNFVRLLLTGGRLLVAAKIKERFVELRREAEQVLDIEVATTHPLDDRRTAALGASLKQHFAAAAVNLRVRVDQNIGGGLLIKAGDHVIDATIPAALARMRAALLRT